MTELLYKQLSYQIQGAAFKVYGTLGCAFKESIYHNAYSDELKSTGLFIENEKRINIYYNNKKVGTYVPDVIAEEKIIIELKSKPFIVKSDQEQFWNYLKSSKYKIGYLINFGKPGGVEIIRRIYDTARVR